MQDAWHPEPGRSAPPTPASQSLCAAAFIASWLETEGAIVIGPAAPIETHDDAAAAGAKAVEIISVKISRKRMGSYIRPPAAPVNRHGHRAQRENGRQPIFSVGP